MSSVNMDPYITRPSSTCSLPHSHTLSFSLLAGTMDERLIELVRGYEELFDMTNRRYSDNCYKDKIWKVIGEELYKPGKSMWSLLIVICMHF